MIIRVRHNDTEVVYDEDHHIENRTTCIKWPDQKEAIHETLNLIFDRIKELYDENN